MIEYKNYLVNWIREEVAKSGQKGVIVGMSGGVDSSVVAAIAKESFPNNSLGVYMPIENMGKDLEDAMEVAKKIKIDTTTVNLTESFNSTLNNLNITKKMAIANIKPRLRMTALYALAQENNYLVLGTDNKAEWLLGYFTKYGDGGVDLLPIIHLTKGEVNKMAEELELPSIVYTKKPSAALWDNQTDEEELGFSYEKVDKYIKGEKIDSLIENKIKHQIKITEHKRRELPQPLDTKSYKK